MSEREIGACPSCQEQDSYVHDGSRICGACGFDAPVDDFGGVFGWNRLSSAAALLRAVETMAPGYVKVKPSEMPGEWVASVQYGRLHDYARADSPAAALIALAQQIGARDAD